jgi:hypothetical protein
MLVDLRYVTPQGNWVTGKLGSTGKFSHEGHSHESHILEGRVFQLAFLTYRNYEFHS